MADIVSILTISEPRSKPWPGDAVMIVCADLGKENRANMESVVTAVCRDCQRRLAADTKTIRLCMGHPSRRGRPVKFFCCRCVLQYDAGTITHFADHSASQQGRQVISVANPQAIDIG